MPICCSVFRSRKKAMLVGEKKSTRTKLYHTISHEFSDFPTNQKCKIVFANVQKRPVVQAPPWLCALRRRGSPAPWKWPEGLAGKGPAKPESSGEGRRVRTQQSFLAADAAMLPPEPV